MRIIKNVYNYPEKRNYFNIIGSMKKSRNQIIKFFAKLRKMK